MAWIGRLGLLTGALLLAGCVRTGDRIEPRTGTAPGPLAELQIIAFNDFHGHISADGQTMAQPGAPGTAPRVKAGGAVHLAQAVTTLRAENSHSAVVAAGDLIGASPLASGHFLDEPTVRVMNDIGLDYSAIGNHEFDRGQAEIKRMQTGRCTKHTLLEPCQVMPDFPGARFKWLAANVFQADGTTLLPAYGIKSFTVGNRTVRVGFIGMTLKGTPAIVSPKSVAGLRFADEAETANALLPALRAAGADIAVLLIHQGGEMPKDAADPNDCANLGGDLNPVLARLDPAFSLVISGHTHQAYICDYAKVDPTRPFLVTSAGLYGMQLTRISLTYDFGAGKLATRNARNVVVTQPGEDAGKQPAVAALVGRYEAAAASVRDRVVGTLGGSLTATADASGQSTLGNFIADAQLAAMAGEGAQIAFMNPGGLRSPINPTADGKVRFGDLYQAQPFGNVLMVVALSGAQIREALEYQFERGSSPTILSVSRGFAYAYDASRPAGSRVFDMTLNRQPVADGATYRVAMSNFLQQGGDGFTMFAKGVTVAEGGTDLDALEAYVRATPGRQPPPLDRIRNATPR